MHFFKKEEKLCSKKAIEAVFTSGRSFLVHPYKISWLISEKPLPYPAQVAILVGKKNYKRAVDRNLIKRRIREAYRLNKNYLYDYLTNRNLNIIMLITYISNEISDYSLMEKKMKLLLEKLVKHYEDNP
jgi:ribonuclease P protein component